VRVHFIYFIGVTNCCANSGGGAKKNKKLDNAAIPVLWMRNEATLAGLRLESSPVEWKWDELENSAPTESMLKEWHLFKIIPFKRLSYNDRTHSTWYESSVHCLIRSDLTLSGCLIYGKVA
jgi:hypothetical protein